MTDELSQENAHFGLSEALLVVIEQYKATRLEQQVMEEQFPPPSSPAPVGSQTFSSASSSPYSVPSTPVDAPYLSSWGSLSSIATNPDGMWCTLVLMVTFDPPISPPPYAHTRYARGACLSWNDPGKPTGVDAVPTH